MINWKLELREIKSLKDFTKNPRILTKWNAEHLQTSMEKFGLIDKPTINADNTIIGGHQRIRLLKKMAVKEVECYVPDRMLDEKEVEELNIRLNRNSGEWDYDCLGNEWNPVELVEWGFDLSELDIHTSDSDVSNEEEEEEHKCPTCGKKTKKAL